LSPRGLGDWGLGSPDLKYILIICFRTQLDQNDLYYSLKKGRGLAIIINHEVFDEIDVYSHGRRRGTVRDLEILKKTFSDLGFEIDLQENKTYKQIMDHISQGISVITYLSYMTEKFVVLGISAFLIEKPGVSTDVSRVSPVSTCKCQ